MNRRPTHSTETLNSFTAYLSKLVRLIGGDSNARTRYIHTHTHTHTH